MNTTFSRKKNRKAFTIIELVVAIGVTAVMVSLMLTIVVNVLSGWNRSTGRLSTAAQARFILDQLRVDLESAIVVRTSDVVFAATIQNDQTVLSDRGDTNLSDANWSAGEAKPGTNFSHPDDSFRVNESASEDRRIENYRFGQAGVWLRFFSIPPDNMTSALDDASAPRAVSYQIVRRQRNSGPFSYVFFRSEVRPYDGADSTFAVGYDLYGSNNYTDFASENDESDEALRIRKPRLESLIGEGVVDFGVRIFVNHTTGLVEAFPVDRRIDNSDNSIRRAFASTVTANKFPAYTTASGNNTPGQTSYGYPAVVEVMLRILTPEGVRIIQSYEDDPGRFGGAFSDAKWWELAEANSRVFTERITILSN